MIYFIIKLLATLFTLYSLYTAGFFETIINISNQRLKRLKNLHRLVSTRHKGIILIIYHSIILLLKTLYSSIVTYLNNNVKKIGNSDNYLITFTIKGKLYKLIINSPRGAENINILQVVDNNYLDITDELTPFIRTSKNIINITPNILGYKNIEILSDSNNLQFESNDIIKL